MTENNNTALAEAPKAQTAVKVADAGDGQDITILSVQQALSKPGLDRVESVVRIPADYQYAITKWLPPSKVREDQVIVGRGENMVEVVDKVGLTIDGYEYLNRVRGVSFFLPEFVHDEQDQKRRNPIHRADYIYLRLAAVWYNDLGQLVYASEDVEVNFKLAYMADRITSKGAEIVPGENGQVQFDEAGNPLVKLRPDQELKALKTFATSRNFGPRYAQSVARVRLLKMATGIRSLPINEPKDFPVKLVGYRDSMTAQQRIAEATSDVANLYGRPSDIKPLSAEEMAEAGIEGAVEETDLDRAAVEQANEPTAEARAVEPEQPEPQYRERQPRDEAAEAAQRPVEGQTSMPLDEDDGLPEMRG